VVVTFPAMEDNDDAFCDIHLSFMMYQMTYQKQNLVFNNDKEIVLFSTLYYFSQLSIKSGCCNLRHLKKPKAQTEVIGSA
jgi:hypothetical protein